MNVYDYYDRIVEKNLRQDKTDDESYRVYKNDDKTIIKNYSELDEKYFDVNVKNFIKEKISTYKDFHHIHSTVISKKNNKVLVNSIFHDLSYTREGKLYYAKRNFFLSFSDKALTTNDTGNGCIRRVSYFQDCYHAHKYKFFLKDLFLHHHPDKKWALDLFNYMDFDYRIKTISKYNSLDEFLKNNCATGRYVNYWYS